MNILVIGNGFDLAHDLKTDYRSFLRYAETCNTETQGEYAEEFMRLHDDRGWMSYFRNQEERLNERWEGFETGLFRAVKVMDEVHRGIVREGGRHAANRDQLEILGYFLDKFYKRDSFANPYVSEEELYSTRKIAIASLAKLTRQLEIYLTQKINNEPVKIQLQEIIERNPDKIITFNYTDTYERVYGEVQEEDICFIHGKATSEHDISEYNTKKFEDEKCVCEEEYKALLQSEKCNMVLGINEYLDEIEAQEDNYFIDFKKFYQRIYKRTGSEYKKWIEDRSDDTDLNVIFFGHSLDVMDKDIIKELVEAKGANVTVLYHNEDALRRLIRNMVAIIGVKDVISRTSSTNATIRFERQKDDSIKI